MGFGAEWLSSFLFEIHLITVLLTVVALLFVSPRLKPLLAFVGLAIGAALTTAIAIAGLSHGVEFTLYGGQFLGNIPIRIDALSAWFILVVNFTSVTGLIYGIGYLKAYNPTRTIQALHYAMFVLFHASMIWVCSVQHSIAFLVSWEIMGLSSLFLIMFDHTDTKVIKAGINYMVQMHLSVVLLTVAFIWVYFKIGTFDFVGIGEFFKTNVNIWLFLLFFVGFGIKAGFIGLHTWLPYAHPAAPSHVSGVMSGVIVKMGIFGIFRIAYFLTSDFLLLGEVVLTLSLLTGLFGIVNAAVHRDFKRMLAYCTIENIGLVGIGIGLGLMGLGMHNPVLYYLGFGGALLHVLNHSLFKSLLFYSAGSVYRQTHTRNMEKLGGLLRKMPHTAFLFLIGALAIGGLPPFNGFISEFLLYSGMFEGFHSTDVAISTLMVLSAAVLSVIGGVSILTFTKSFGTIFLGTPRQELKSEPTEVSKLMLLPQYATVAAMMAVAIFPGYFIRIAGSALCWQHFSSIELNTLSISGYESVLSHISLWSLIFIAMVGAVYTIRLWFSRTGVETTVEPTWGCGYTAPSPRLQYTGKSFSKSLGKLLNFILIEKKSYSELTVEEVFPQERKYSSYYHDFFEFRIIDPLVKGINRFIGLFLFVQNGRVQAYVVYGIVFIVVALLFSLVGVW